MARIGSLFVNLGLESATFTEGLKRARKHTTGFGAEAQKMAKTVGMAFAAVGAAAAGATALLVRPVMNATKAMDDLAKTAQKVGTSVGDLSKLRFAGALAGLDNAKLQTGLTRLNVAITGLGSTAPEATRQIRALGIAANTGTLEAMKALADRFAAMEDGPRKAALAVQIFGKAGADLIPLLNGGSEAIAKAANEAERLGLVIDTKTAKAAEQFNDNLTRLQAVQNGVITQLTAGMVPAFVALTDALARSAGLGQQWSGIGKTLGTGLVNVAQAAFVVYESISAVTGAVIALGRAAGAAFSGNFRDAVGIIQEQEFSTRAFIEGRRAAFARIRTDIALFKPGEGAGGAGAMATGVGGVAESVDKIGAAAKTARTELTRRQKALERIAEARSAAFQETAARLTAEANADIPFSAANLKPVVTIFDQMAARMDRVRQFGEGFSKTLAQAVIYSGNIGDALVNSIKAAAAEALASGLFKLFFGERGSISGGLFGSVLAGVFGAPGFPMFGGFRADGGPVQSGKAYMVGERGPELFMPAMSGAIVPNGGSAQGLVVSVEPSPLFITSVRQVAVQGGAAAAVETIRRERRAPIPGGGR